MILVKFVDRSDDVHWINIDQICSITPRSDSNSERKMSGSRMRVNGYSRSLNFKMSPEELTKYLQEEARKAKYGLVGDIQTSSLEEVDRDWCITAPILTPACVDHVVGQIPDELGFDPADECQNDNHDPGCVCGAQHWMTAPAPAVPAGEETKAEDYCCHPMCRHTNWGGSNRKHTRGSDCPIVPKPTSSPVVPAPTETGPWQTWEAVPDGVWYVSRDDVTATHYVNSDGLRYRGFDGAKSKNSDCEMSRLAPFVAAKEG